MIMKMTINVYMDINWWKKQRKPETVKQSEIVKTAQVPTINT
jgi:hypothetical protein